MEAEFSKMEKKGKLLHRIPTTRIPDTDAINNAMVPMTSFLASGFACQ